MSATSVPSIPTTTAPGGNVYVGPSLASSLLRVAAALAAAQR
jgi:hypothetical protein